VVDLITHSGEARERLSEQAYTTLEPGNPLGLLQEALELTEKNEELETKLRLARKEGLIKADYFGYQIDEAEHAEIISNAEATELRDYPETVLALLAVDAFDASTRARVVSGSGDGGKIGKTTKRAAAKKVTKRKSSKAATGDVAAKKSD
jgi:acyl-CoA dehydrogenase